MQARPLSKRSEAQHTVWARTQPAKQQKLATMAILVDRCLDPCTVVCVPSKVLLAFHTCAHGNSSADACAESQHSYHTILSHGGRPGALLHQQ